MKYDRMSDTSYKKQKLSSEFFMINSLFLLLFNNKTFTPHYTQATNQKTRKWKHTRHTRRDKPRSEKWCDVQHDVFKISHNGIYCMTSLQPGEARESLGPLGQEQATETGNARAFLWHLKRWPAHSTRVPYLWVLGSFWMLWTLGYCSDPEVGGQAEDLLELRVILGMGKISGTETLIPKIY